MAFNETVDLERSLLSGLTNLTVCRKHLQSVRREFFTSDTRSFIFQVIHDTFKNTRNEIKETVVLYEISKSIEPARQKYYISEWNLISQLNSIDPVETLIAQLDKAVVGKRMLQSMSDIIDLVNKGDIEKAITSYKRSAVDMNVGILSHPIVEITDSAHREKLIQDKKDNPDKYLGIRTGWKTFDDITGGLFPGEFTLVAGVTGLGKSTLVKQLAYNVATKNKNKNVLLVANEESQIQVETKFDSLITEMAYNDFKRAKLSDGQIQTWKEKLQEMKANPDIGRIFVKEVPAFTDVTLVEEAYRELEAKGIIIDVIVIDHLPHIVPIRAAYGEVDEKGKAASDCKQLAKDLNCALVVPSQAATEVEAKQTKGKRAGKLDVYGGKGQIHVANTFIIITKKGHVDDPNLEVWQQDVVWLFDVKKQRDGACFCFTMRHFVNCGKVEEFDDKGFYVGKPAKIEEELVDAVEDMVGELDSKTAKDETEVVEPESDDIDMVGETVAEEGDVTYFSKQEDNSQGSALSKWLKKKALNS